MRKIREILRLRLDCGRTYQEIAISLGVGKTSVGDCVSRATVAGLTSWPLPDDLDDHELERRLYPEHSQSGRVIPMPDWAYVHAELKRKHVTKQTLWWEYKTAQPDGYQYTQFCDLYREWSKTADLVFRNEHKAGERLFVDYAGSKVPIHDPATGDVSYASIFVAVMGASNKAYVEASIDQSSESWIGSHVRAFEYFGAVPAVVVPDNLKSGVTKPCRYEALLNASYEDMARHYRTVVIPARSKRPKDKAKVESGVLLVCRWILAALRNHTFFCLAQLNMEIAGLLDKLNRRPFKKLPGCRDEMFESIDKPAMKSLPASRYEFVHIKLARVNIDYHVEVDGHYYSAPYTLVGRQVEVRYSETTIEMLHGNHRVASHQRSAAKGRHTTVEAHRPEKHQAYVKWTPERMQDWAANAGEATGRLAKAIMESRVYPELGFRSVLGLIRLGEKFGNARLEAASLRAIQIGNPTYTSVKSILKKGLDHNPPNGDTPEQQSVSHANIRGRGYFQ
jgi:transposase